MPLTIRDYYSNDLERFDLWSETDLNIEGCDMCHTDLPRLIKGKVGGQVRFTKKIYGYRWR